MQPDRVVYAGPKRPDLYQAIAKGFGARVVDSRTARPIPGTVHFIGGLQHGSLEIMKAVRAAGEPYVFFDRAYFGGGPGTDCFRVCFGSYQHNVLIQRPDDRVKRLRVTPQPWRVKGRHILLVPPSQAICTLFGLGDWGENMRELLQGLTDRPIDVSHKGDPRPLAARLKDCHAVITWTSNVAVEAIVAGVPAFVARESAARPVAGMVEALSAEHLEQPPLPCDREAWLRHLAYGQFTLAEIAAGTAADMVLA